MAKAKAKAEKTEKPKFEKSVFVDTCPAEMKNDDGLLTTIPDINNDLSRDDEVTPGVFSPTHHTAPKKAEFATEADFMMFKSTELELRANAMLERSASLRENAEAFRKYGDPAIRKKVQRAQKLREQLAQLEAAMANEGIEI